MENLDAFYEALEHRLASLISQLDGVFTDAELQEVREFVEHCEYGISVETVIDIAVEENHSLTQEVLDELADLCRTMDMEIPGAFDAITVRQPTASPQPGG